MSSLILYFGIGIIAFLFVVIVSVRVYGGLLRKVGPNQALIVFGRGGTKVVKGGAEFVIPLFQRAQEFLA